MRKLLGQRKLLFLLIVIVALTGAVACSDSEEEREPDAPSGTGEGTPPGDVALPTDDPETVSTAEENETQEALHLTPEIDITPGAEGQPPAGEAIPGAERTVTPGADTVGPEGDLFPDIRTQGPDLENYTMTIIGETNRTDMDADQPENIDLTFEQSAPDTFHLLFDGADEFAAEVWSAGGDMWIRDEEGITEAPEGFAEDFDIGTYLSMLPEIERVDDAEDAGEEDIEGRTTIHYTIPAHEAAGYLPGLNADQMQDPEGSIEVWLDEAENVVIRMIVDLTWTDSENTENSTNIEYNVTAIGETAEVEPPSQ